MSLMPPLRPQTVFVAHAAADHDFALELARFVEFGCDAACIVDDGLETGGDLIARAEEGMASDLLVLLLSPASCPRRWPRQRWEPVLFDQARASGAELISILLDDCPFPELLRRRNFLEATTNRQRPLRLLKRLVWQRNANLDFTPGLEQMYAAVADRAGMREVDGAIASQFAAEAAAEFAAVLWVPCYRRTLAQVAGELGAQLGLTLDGTAEQNCSRLRDFLFHRRCLVVLDAPDPQTLRRLAHLGRTSLLSTKTPVRVLDSPDSPAAARDLVLHRRYAEAYEVLYRLLHAGVDTEGCARELTWICDHWDRVDEANSLRFLYGPSPTEQLSLF